MKTCFKDITSMEELGEFCEDNRYDVTVTQNPDETYITVEHYENKITRRFCGYKTRSELLPIIKDMMAAVFPNRYVGLTKGLNASFLDKKFNLPRTSPFKIKKVIFNDPATIILWADGTKTVVKAGEDDEFDPEKGMAMAITKKVLGNKGNYFNEIKKWTDLYWEEQEKAMAILLENAGAFLRSILGDTVKCKDIKIKGPDFGGGKSDE